MTPLALGRGRRRDARRAAAAPKAKQPVRRHYPNLSPTRPPVVAADVALWPGWRKLGVEDLDYDLLDDNGFPLGEGGRS